MPESNFLRTALPFFVLLIAGAFGYGSFRFYTLTQRVSIAEEQHIAYQTQLAEAHERFALLEASTTILEGELYRTQNALLAKEEENIDLSERLGIAVEDNTSLKESITDINEKIGLIDKLTKTDKQLLAKYSKVYFLNENYVPASLATVTPEFVFDKKKTLLIHGQVAPHLEALLRAAGSSSQPLLIVSAYRSFYDQVVLKTNYTVTYGSGANKFSADQGYSEHQLGTTVDFTTPLLGSTFTKFDTTSAYQWLTANAFKYGFVLSYPKNNTYYIYEPWHWRYVGVVLAARLHQEGRYFYDLDQRDINGYLIDLFD